MMYDVSYYARGCAPADAAEMWQVQASDLAGVVQLVLDFSCWGWIADFSYPVLIGQGGRVLASIDLSTGGVTYA